jgi:hypothetical protein
MKMAPKEPFVCARRLFLNPLAAGKKESERSAEQGP